MGRKQQKIAARRAKVEQAQKIDAVLEKILEEAGLEEIYNPKAGPGQEFVQELQDAKSGNAQRWRNIGASPLMMAYYRGQLAGPEEKKLPEKCKILASDRFAYGEQFEKWWKIKASVSSRDSTIPAISGGTVEFWTEAKAHASKQIAFIRARMSLRNFFIVQAFCGEGYSMVESLRFAAIQASPDGTAFRVREALDDLVCAATGRDWLRDPVDQRANHSRLP